MIRKNASKESVCALAVICLLLLPGWSWFGDTDSDNAAAAYVKTYLARFGLLPILVPTQQRPGDVFTTDNLAVVYSRAGRCFLPLTYTISRGSNLFPVQDLSTKSSVEVAVGLPDLAEAKLSWSDIDAVRISYTDVEIISAEIAALRSGFRASDPACSLLSDVVMERVAAPPRDGRLFVVVGTVVRAKKNVEIQMKTALAVNVSVTDLNGLLMKVASEAGISLETLDIQAHISGTSTFLERISYRTKSPIEVAFAPAFIPTLIKKGLAGPDSPPTKNIEGLQWTGSSPEEFMQDPSLRQDLQKAAAIYTFGVGKKKAVTRD